MRKVVLGLVLALVISLDLLLAGHVRAARPADTSVSGADIVQTALRYLGYAYTTVGNSPATGFSCIGFVSYVYQSNGIPLPDDLWDAQAYAPAVAFSDLRPGDILFFQNTVWAGLSHTAIYLGGGRFVHAEWYNRGVVTSSFTGDPVDGDYWMAHYLGANRPWGVATTTSPASSPPAGASDAPASPPTPHLRPGPRARVEVADLNIRLRPSLLAPIGGLTTEGTKLVLLKQYRTWDWVQLPDGSFGWVSNEGIGAGNTPSGGVRAASRPLLLSRVWVNGLRVHVRPSWTAPAVASAYRGQRLLVMKRWNRWLWVLLPDGTGGWVREGFVASTGAGASGGPIRSGSIVRVRHLDPLVTAGTRLRARPGTRAAVVTLAGPGTRIAIMGAWHRWIYGRFPNGKAGWVFGAYIKR